MRRAEEIKDTAERVLERLQADRLPVRPADILRRCRRTRIYTYTQAEDALEMDPAEIERISGGADAFTLRFEEETESSYIVCYRERGNPARLNFTLAHELGHIVLRHEGRSTAEEREADLFASCLLCPDEALDGLDHPTADRLARLCYVSRACAEQAVRRREKDLPPKRKNSRLAKYIRAYVENGERHLLRWTNEKR